MVENKYKSTTNQGFLTNFIVSSFYGKSYNLP